MIPTILKCWHGEEKLYIVFWVWGVLVGTFISFVMEFLWWPYGFVPLQNIRFGKSFESIGYFNLFLLLVILVLGIICLLYWIWVIISIWRCSWNVKNKKWGWAARIVVSLAVVLNFVSIIFFHDIGISDKEVTVEQSKITFSKNKIPSSEEWSKIKIGLNKESVISLIGKPPNFINLEDGSAVWQYWNQKATGKENMKYLLAPWGDVYMIYFDSTGKVYKKSFKKIPKPNL